MPKRKRSERSKRWCFTLNNPTQEEEESIAQALDQLKNSGTVNDTSNTMKLTYLISGREQISTIHLQGYCELQNKTSLSTMKAWMPRAHWEKAMGTSLEASDYCKKDGNFQEAGTLLPGRVCTCILCELELTNCAI